MKTFNFMNKLFFILVVLGSSSIFAQNFSDLDKSPLDIASFPTSYKDSNKEIKVIYSRPQLKGRELSTLAPNGKVWRTGANEAVELVLYTDFNLGETTLKAGTYSLATIPGETEWTIIINSDLNTWGSYYYNEKKDIARITVPVTKSSKSLEAFSIAFEGDSKITNMHLAWGTVRVAVPFVKVK